MRNTLRYQAHLSSPPTCWCMGNEALGVKFTTVVALATSPPILARHEASNHHHSAAMCSFLYPQIQTKTTETHFHRKGLWLKIQHPFFATAWLVVEKVVFFRLGGLCRNVHEPVSDRKLPRASQSSSGERRQQLSPPIR